MPTVISFRRKGLNLTRMLADRSIMPDTQKPSNKVLSNKRRKKLTRKLWPVSKTKGVVVI